MAVALALEKISKSFGSTEVLHDINLHVDDGEFVVFVGPSGCGKSTLLRIIAGLEDATTGSVAIAGKQVTTLPPAEREISMVFQTYALYPHLTVRGNLELGLKQAKRPAAHIAEQVAAATKMLELDPYLKRRPAELSGGQRQRVAIGRAIVRKPRLFLFDEPLSNLDAALRANTRLEIARLHNELASSMVYVTHDQVEAMTLADRIVVLRDGRIEQIGTPMDLYNDPDNMFVASFLGIPNINFLPASMLSIANAKTVGLRPEHISLSANPGKLAGTVSHVEQLGGDTNVYLQIEGEQQLTVRLFGQHKYERNAKLGIDFEQDKLLRFDDKSMRLR